VCSSDLEGEKHRERARARPRKGAPLRERGGSIVAHQLSWIAGPSQSFEHGRDPLDRYYTPDAVARACVGVLPELA